jgi:hypothetical protein
VRNHKISRFQSRLSNRPVSGGSHGGIDGGCWLSLSVAVGGLGVIVVGGGWVVVVERKLVTCRSRTTGFGKQRSAGHQMSLLCHQLCHNKCHCGSVGYSACLHVLAGLGFNSQTMPFFFTLLYINKGIRLCLNTFITILIKSIWTVPCGLFHGIHMDWFMWNVP